MKRIRRRSALLSVLGLLAASLAVAQPGKPVAPMVKSGEAAAAPSGDASRGASSARASPAQERQVFRRLDLDNDGYLSDRELLARPAERNDWIALDKDRDGLISPDEFAALADR